MSIIKPNFPLIKKIQLELHEISKITFAEEFDKDVVQGKINVLINDLRNLNKIQKDTLEEYSKKNKELFEHMQSHIEEIARVTNATHKYSAWSLKYCEIIENGDSVTEKFLEEGKKYETVIELAAKNPNSMNQILVKEVLGTYLQIKFTKKRRQSIWWNYQIFRFNIFYRSVLNVVISCIIGYCIEKVSSIVFAEIPDFFITIGLGILFFFTLEKFLGEKFSAFFWQLVRKQTFSLHLELNIYLQQLKIGR